MTFEITVDLIRRDDWPFAHAMLVVEELLAFLDRASVELLAAPIRGESAPVLSGYALSRPGPLQSAGQVSMP